MNKFWFLSGVMALMLFFILTFIIYEPKIKDKYEKCDSLCKINNEYKPCDCKEFIEKERLEGKFIFLNLSLAVYGIIILWISFIDNINKKDDTL